MEEASRVRNRYFLLICALLLLPLCFLGYGSDNDTFTVLDCARLTWHFHAPDTSRNPGYWVFEAIVYALSQLGGYAATNLATLAVGLVVLWRFLAIAERMEVRFPRLVAAALVATPVFAIACTSTVDYLWSLVGIVLFAELLLADRPALAVLPAAFAFAIRGANGVVIAGAIVGALAIPVVCRKRVSLHSLRVVGVGVAAAVLGGLPYVASYRLAHHSFAFLHPLAGPEAMWSSAMRLGRFGYKSVYLFGPVALAVLGWAWWRTRDSGMTNPEGMRFREQARPIFLGLVIANALLFLKFPIEISYLIPAAYFLLLLLGTNLLASSRAVAIAFLLAVVSLDVVTPQLAQPAAPGHATGARLHPGLATGALIQDLRLRSALRGCSDYTCYYLHFHPGGHGMDPVRPLPQPKRLE
jgi:hypothetical protein